MSELAPIFYLTRDDRVESTEYTRDRATDHRFFNTEDDAYAELLHRLKDRAQAVEDRWQESIRRRFGL